MPILPVQEASLSQTDASFSVVATPVKSNTMYYSMCESASDKQAAETTPMPNTAQAFASAAAAPNTPEIQQRIQELAQNLGSAFGRLISETMNPLIRRTLAIILKRGQPPFYLRVCLLSKFSRITMDR